MSTLSKQAIEGIAKKMTEKSKKYYESLEQDLKKLATVIYEEYLPDIVKKCFKEHPSYIETSQHIYLDSHGFNRETVQLAKQLPATSNYHNPMKLTAPVADKILTAKRKAEKAKKDYDQLVQETESALYALKTAKNIRENLPEAVPFLPPPMSNSLVVNFGSLQKKLGKQPEIERSVKV